jgi:hypothetical protein
VITLTFRSDHQVLKYPDPNWKPAPPPKTSKDAPLPTSYGDTGAKRFPKPEWKKIRPVFPGPAQDEDRIWLERMHEKVESHPISHTKGRRIRLDLKVRVTVTPSDASVTFLKIKGELSASVADRRIRINFSRLVNRAVVGTEEFEIENVVSKEKLPNVVGLIEDEQITWLGVFQVGGRRETRSLNQTGPHTIFITLDKPSGKLVRRPRADDPYLHEYAEDGADQVVTPERLRWAVKAAEGTGAGDERHVLDAIFFHLKRATVRYNQTFTWQPRENRTGLDLNRTGLEPKPSLHHYLWLINDRLAFGQCHCLAAAFILACKILGVKGKLEVGYMYPWARREHDPPHNPRKPPVHGRYNKPDKRMHVVRMGGETHRQWEVITYVDSGGGRNPYESVARYQGGSHDILYAIGEALLDLEGDPDKNADVFFADWKTDNLGRIPRDRDTKHRSRPRVNFAKGQFELAFTDVLNNDCKRPYPWSAGSTFRWED